MRAAIDEIIDHGFTGVECPLHLEPDDTRAIVEYLRSRGMYLIYDRTFDKAGVEGFGRDKPAPVSVFSRAYPDLVRRNIDAALEAAKPFTHVHSAFLYQVEPFHAGPESFDYSEDAVREFRRRYGYELPPDVAAARTDPKIWQDVIEFRSSEFVDGWKRVYAIVKQANPSLQVIMTHDSHSTFGAGVGSNAKIAVEDVFHWGADFADLFVFDIYPHMMFDFRYGDCGLLPQPRFSQMHYALAQMRNLAYANGKPFGFWFGTFNKRWFSRFMTPELRAKHWTERETSLTAVAHGANFLISGYLIPEDEGHWASLGQGLRVIGKIGSELLEMPKKKANACFLFPRTQYIQLQEEYWNVGLSFELFLQAFGELDVLHEDQVIDDRLADYPLLTLLDVRLLPEEIGERIGSFVRRGGTVIADCVPNLDRFATPSSTMANLFGVRDAATGRIARTGVWVPSIEKAHWFVPQQADEQRAVVRQRVRGTAFNQPFDFIAVSPRPCMASDADVLLKTADGHPALVRRRVGSGRVYLLGFCAQDSYFQTFRDSDSASREQLRQLLWSITSDAGVRPHVRSTNPDIEATVRLGCDAGYVFVINHEALSPRTEIHLANLGFSVGRIVDVATQRRVAFERHGGDVSISLAVMREQPAVLRVSGQNQRE